MQAYAGEVKAHRLLLHLKRGREMNRSWKASDEWEWWSRLCAMAVLRNCGGRAPALFPSLTTACNQAGIQCTGCAMATRTWAMTKRAPKGNQAGISATLLHRRVSTIWWSSAICFLQQGRALLWIGTDRLQTLCKSSVHCPVRRRRIAASVASRAASRVAWTFERGRRARW